MNAEEYSYQMRIDIAELRTSSVSDNKIIHRIRQKMQKKLEHDCLMILTNGEELPKQSTFPTKMNCIKKNTIA